MPLYLISYVLRKDRDYSKLIEELTEIGSVRILDSVWRFKRANTNANELLDHFSKLIDSDDRLFVCQFSDNASLRTLDNSNNS